MDERLSTRDRALRAPVALRAEAGRDIVSASLSLRLRPFDRIVCTLERPANNPAADPDTAYWIRRAVSAWGRRLPWRAKCFEQGLAAAAMLGRRGLAYEVHYGAASTSDALTAHVWVTSGGIAVVGCENATDHTELAVFAG